MKLSFFGTPLADDKVFKDADTGESDQEDRQASEPVRLFSGPRPLTKRFRDKLIDRYYDRATDQQAMLREVGVSQDEINALLAEKNGSLSDGWTLYEARLNSKRHAEWYAQDQQRPHLDLWGFRNKMIKVEGWEPFTREEVVVRVKHFVLSAEAEVSRLRREVEVLENFGTIQSTNREPIPEEVRMYVWRRDNGCCVKCGSNDRLEYDHIVPVVLGGSNTERNVQLLCEPCNRRKGATV